MNSIAFLPFVPEEIRNEFGTAREPKPRGTARLRRRVYRVRPEPDKNGTYTFRSHSFTYRDAGRYLIIVNPNTGERACTCADFRYRHAHDGGLCKHLRRALRTVQIVERRRDQLADQKIEASIQPSLDLAA